MGVGLALALGLLVGIQRGWTFRNLPDGARFAGIRTYGLLGLAGGMAGVLYTHAEGPALILLAAAAVLVVVGYRRSSSGTQVSGTASMVGLITIASGFMAGMGERLLGTTIAVAMVALLSLRGRLHSWINHLEEREVMAIARFAVIAMVILPLLPDRGFGPYDAWNPRQLWAVVVMVSGFSFCGYFAAKWLGASRGHIATAAAGAVVSSTAVTAGMAKRMREGAASPAVLSAAISAASVVMYLRVAVLVGLLAPFALPHLAVLIAPGALVSLAAAAWSIRTATRAPQDAPGEVGVRNPFDLGPALLLTVLVMALTVVAHWVLETFGDQGLALVLAVSGIVDVDSAIITMGNLPPGTLEPLVAGTVLAIPVTLNTIFKGVVAIGIAGWSKGKLGALPLFASALATGLAWLVIR
ncbi:membrane protein [Erythrobacter sp. SG61-1L]|nr:membrane protein [Erythrobacter sp. SG61-1L]